MKKLAAVALLAALGAQAQDVEVTVRMEVMPDFWSPFTSPGDLFVITGFFGASDLNSDGLITTEEVSFAKIQNWTATVESFSFRLSDGALLDLTARHRDTSENTTFSLFETHAYYNTRSGPWLYQPTRMSVTQTSPVPEPAGWALMLGGLTLLLGRSRLWPRG